LVTEEKTLDILHKAQRDAYKRFVKIGENTAYNKPMPLIINELESKEKRGTATTYDKRKLENLKSLKEMYTKIKEPVRELAGECSAARIRFSDSQLPGRYDNLTGLWKMVRKNAKIVAKELEDHNQKRGAEIYRNVVAVADSYLGKTPKVRKAEKRPIKVIDV